MKGIEKKFCRVKFRILISIVSSFIDFTHLVSAVAAYINTSNLDENALVRDLFRMFRTV